MREPIRAINYPYGIDQGLGRLAVETDYAEHVRQLMLQVLFTNPGERVNRPDFGCGIRRMVFAPNHEASAELGRVSVFQALEKWLGNLIEVDQVEVNPVDEVLEVKIAYLLKARQERRFLNLEVTL